jgi:hypothetical protein
MSVADAQTLDSPPPGIGPKSALNHLKQLLLSNVWTVHFGPAVACLEGVHNDFGQTPGGVMKKGYLQLNPVWMLAVLTVGAAGCVNNASAPAASKLAVQNGGFTLSNPFPNPSPAPSPAASPGPTLSPRPSNPIQVYRVEAIGYNAATVTVTARKILRVRFTPGVQDQMVAGTGFSPTYSRLGVYLSAGGATALPTPMLSNGLFSPKTSSSIMDFSAQIPKTCAETDTACRETLTIKVDKPNNDYWCMNFGAYCNWTWVYETHPWNGTLEVETDDTQVMR